MNYTYLNSFLTTAECLNFTKAANRLHISQSALSRQIIQLEESLGAKLLLRSKHGVQLTAAGNVLFAEAKDLVHQTDYIAQKVRRVAQTEAGVIRVTGPALYSHEIIRIFNEYNSLVPDCDVTMQLSTTGQITEFLDRRIADVGFAFGEIVEFDSQGYQTMRVCDDRIVLVSAPDHPFSKRNKVDLADLATETLLYFGGENGAMSRLDNAHERLRAYFSKVEKVDSLGTLILDILMGEGIGLMPTILARNKCADCSMVDIDGIDLNISVIMLWCGENMNPSLQQFIESVRATVMKMSKGD